MTPAPRIWPKLVPASNWGKPSVGMGEGGLLPRSWVAKRAIASPRRLQIIITRPIVRDQVGVLGTVACTASTIELIKVFSPKLRNWHFYAAFGNSIALIYSYADRSRSVPFLLLPRVSAPSSPQALSSGQANRTFFWREMFKWRTFRYFFATIEELKVHPR